MREKESMELRNRVELQAREMLLVEEKLSESRERNKELSAAKKATEKENKELEQERQEMKLCVKELEWKNAELQRQIEYLKDVIQRIGQKLTTIRNQLFLSSKYPKCQINQSIAITKELLSGIECCLLDFF